MPYNTVSSSTNADAAFMNDNYRDQVVSQFASAAARDSAIASGNRKAGMVAAVADNTSAEGLYLWTSAGTWRLPWAMPWGIVGQQQRGDLAAAGLTNSETDINLSVTWTAVANRQYQATAMVRFTGTATEQVQLTLTNGTNTAITGLGRGTISAASVSDLVINAVSPVFTRTAGSQTVKLRAQRIAGTNQFSCDGGGVFIMHLTISDIGPAGVPA